jgi:hypothetical protein
VVGVELDEGVLVGMGVPQAEKNKLKEIAILKIQTFFMVTSLIGIHWNKQANPIQIATKFRNHSGGFCSIVVIADQYYFMVRGEALVRSQSR